MRSKRSCDAQLAARAERRRTSRCAPAVCVHARLLRSGAAIRAAAALRLWLACADESTRELVLDERCDAVDVDPRIAQKRTRIVDLVDAPGFDFDVGEPGRAQLVDVLGIAQRAGDAPDPQFDVPP